MQFRTIIAAIDLDDDLASSVVSVAHSLAEKDKASLEIVTAWPSINMTTAAFSAEVAASAAAISAAAVEQHKKARADAETRIQKLARDMAPEAKAVVIDGDPGDALADYAEKQRADLIVTGSHQRKFWDTLLQGSASRALVKEAPCAVFLVTKPYAQKLAAES